MASIGLAIFVAGLPLLSQTPRLAQANSKPTESEHVKGPYGLEGWTLNWPVESRDSSERYAMVLVLARDGHIVRRIEGDPFIWKWMFWSDGSQVAYETGPLHFSMSCVLANTKTGRKLASVDCEYQDLPKNAPEWLQALVDMQ